MKIEHSQPRLGRGGLPHVRAHQVAGGVTSTACHPTPSLLPQPAPSPTKNPPWPALTLAPSSGPPRSSLTTVHPTTIAHNRQTDSKRGPGHLMEVAAACRLVAAQAAAAAPCAEVPALGGDDGGGGGWQEGVQAAAGRHYRACLTCRVSKIKCDGSFPCGVRGGLGGLGWDGRCVFLGPVLSAFRRTGLRGRSLSHFPPTGPHNPLIFDPNTTPPPIGRPPTHAHAQRCFRLSQPCQPQFWRKDPYAGLRGTELVFKTVDPRVRVCASLNRGLGWWCQAWMCGMWVWMWVLPACFYVCLCRVATMMVDMAAALSIRGVRRSECAGAYRGTTRHSHTLCHHHLTNETTMRMGRPSRRSTSRASTRSSRPAAATAGGPSASCTFVALLRGGLCVCCFGGGGCVHWIVGFLVGGGGRPPVCEIAWL